MSMAVRVASRQADLTGRVATGITIVLALLLVAAAIEQSASGVPASRVAGLAALVCAVVLLGAISAWARRGGRASPEQIRILPDGSVRILQRAARPRASAAVDPDEVDAAEVAARVLVTRRVAGLIYLRLIPTSDSGGSGAASAGARVARRTAGADRGQSPAARRLRPTACDCLLGRGRLGATDWAAVSRWLVWRRRTGAAPGNASLSNSSS